jgi:precorrin-6A synthase
MIRVLGMGTGLHQITPEVADALRASDYVIAASKRDDDGLLALRREVCEAYDLPLIVVPDPERDRDDPADYPRAVADWHRARVEAYRKVLHARGGEPAFLVWGDPALYDSTIRIVRDLDPDYEVLPGVSAPQLLAARHRIVLHEVGQPVLITTQRRLPSAVAEGATNVVVMLTSGFVEAGIEDWRIWWGANLGTRSERLVCGLVGEVADDIRAARAAAKAQAGWVMDLFLVRRP